MRELLISLLVLTLSFALLLPGCRKKTTKKGGPTVEFCGKQLKLTAQLVYCISRDGLDLAPLKKLSKLRFIGIQRSKIKDISVLKELKNLRTVNLVKTEVSDISALAGLTRLVALNLSHSPIKDISALKSLTNLTLLRINGTYVTDITPLYDLPRLTRLNVQGTKVPAEQLKKLKAKLPGLVIDR